MSKVREEMIEKLRGQMKEACAVHNLIPADVAWLVSELAKDHLLHEHVNDIQAMVSANLHPKYTGVQFRLSASERYVFGVLFGEVILVQTCEDADA